jgi:hypothetical protein
VAWSGLNLPRRGLAVALLATAALVAATAEPAGAFLFARPVGYSIGNDSARWLAGGDLNGDGNTDIAVLTDTTGVVVFLGHPNGTFTAGPTLPTGNFSNQVVIANALDAGRQDIVVADNPPLNGDVLIFPGHGDGTFGTPMSLSLPYPPHSVAVGDLNGDGIPDVAATVDGVGNQTEVYVFFGKGGGQFTAPTILSPGGTSPQAIALVRLAGPSSPLDIVTLNLDGTLSVLLGNGSGGFTAAAPTTVGGMPYGPGGIAVGDLNGDNIPDLLVANGSQIVPLVSKGNGTFTALTPVNDPAASTVVLGNFTGGSNLDIAATAAGDPVIYPGLGDGRFGPAVGSPYYTGTWLPDGQSIVSGDFNHDGKADLAFGVEDFGPKQLSGIAVLLNSVGTVMPTPKLVPSTPRSCYVIKTVPGSGGVATIGVTGSGFPAGDQVDIRGSAGIGGQGTASARGGFTASLMPSPALLTVPDHLRLTATDQQETDLTASTAVRATPFAVASSDTSTYLPEHQKFKFAFSGFTPGKPIYEHYVLRGRLHRTVRVARASGPCGLARASIRWAFPHPRPGLWSLQFDSRSRYSPRTVGRWVFAYLPTNA